MPAATEFLIIGSGIAGLRAAVDLAEHGDVTILTKADPTESNTGYAQGGIAAAVGPEDAPEEHFADTIAAGAGLCDEAAVRVLVEDGVEYVRELLEWGAFDRDPSGAPLLGREAAHRVRRVLHARDATGREISRLMWSRVVAHPRVRVRNHTRVTALTLDAGGCRGAAYVDRDGAGAIEASAVLLATGGAGRVFSDTTNPPVATGDGIALAWQAGARVADLEFVQFHPTALDVADAPRFLLSEALRGEGAHLVNARGERFMARYADAGELAPRDVVARAMVAERARTGGATFLSLQHLDADWVRARFPTITAACQSVGLDLATDLVPVGPAAHYVMGGVDTDTDGRTTLPGLYAAGEVACTGVHGANRLASNSLLEGLVFGARAAVAMREARRAGGLADVRLAAAGPAPAPPLPGGSIVAIQREMWKAVGLAREAVSLEAAIARLDGWRRALSASSDPSDLPVVLLATVAWLMAKAALRREESRGGHFRTDFPVRDDLHWQIHIAETC